MISQVAKAAFGTAWYGHLGFVLVQLATALILFTGANTPFTGFPFLASFIAEDSFLPRQLTRRGHRLAFSNGIIVLTVLAALLVAGVGAHVDKLVPFYAIGVFTGFTMAGFGMAKYHHTRREQRLAAQAGDQLRRRPRVDADRADLRGGQVHRGRLAGGAAVPGRLAGADAAQHPLPRRGPRAGSGYRELAKPRRCSTTPGTWCWCWSTGWTWP